MPAFFSWAILNLSEIYKNDDIYTRDKFEEKRIEFFSELMKAGIVFPSIKVARDGTGKYAILDGFHRYSAFEKLKRAEITCDLINAEPKMWRLLSVRFNFDSSQPFRLGEIKKVIRDAWRRDEIRDKHQIAGMIGCTIQWVRKVTKELDLEGDAEKLALARKIQKEENVPIRDIAERVGWTKSKTHRMLNEPPKSVEPPSRPETQKDQTTEVALSKTDDGKQKPNEPLFNRPNESSKISTGSIILGNRIKKKPSNRKNTDSGEAGNEEGESHPLRELPPPSVIASCRGSSPSQIDVLSDTRHNHSPNQEGYRGAISQNYDCLNCHFSP